jgi:hypothetical protein
MGLFAKKFSVEIFGFWKNWVVTEADSSTSGHGVLSTEEHTSGHSGATSGHGRLGPVVT